MEILIIGVIFVALMAYVSTRIKRSARAAYEQEVFEHDAFTISKPEGFIIPYSQNSPYQLEIYSKDFGDGEAKKLHQCWAVVSVENTYRKESSTRTKSTENDVAINLFTKTIGDKRSNRSYKLAVSSLDEYGDNFSEKINLMLDSFTLR